jgi:tubulin-specific chaperone E
VTAGSFVRPNRPSDPPRSFLEALNLKYASNGSNSSIQADGKVRSAIEQNDLDQKPITISGKIAEEVGFDKIRRQLADLHELRIVILDGLNVCQDILRLEARKNLPRLCGHDSESIRTVCPKIAELDLSRNLFQYWTEVEFICSQLMNLRLLRLE